MAALAIGLTLAIGVDAPVSAHRLDEYLQAARIAIEPGRVAIELDLTPGTAVAANVLADIDRNRNRFLADDEALAYATAVVRELRLEIDGRDQPLTLAAQRFPAIDAMLNGEGTIRLQLVAEIAPLAAGNHRLRFRNGHRPDVSVYLANALVPATDRVGVLAQDRDLNQSELVIAYRLRDTVPDTARWLTARVGGVVIILIVPAVMWLSRRASRRSAD